MEEELDNITGVDDTQDTKPTIQIVDHDDTGNTEKEKVDGAAVKTEVPSIQIVDSSFAATRDNVVEGLDVEDYKDILGDDIYVPVGGVEAMQSQRAQQQPWHEQALGFLNQAVIGEIVGGTLEGLGYLLDVDSMVKIAKGEEAEWSNMLSDVGKDLRTWTQEATPIHVQNPGTFDMSDSGWWFSNATSVASTLSMLIPSTAATKGLGYLGRAVSRGFGALDKTLDIASRMNKSRSWATQGITQAVVSRHIENSMEASGTFESAMNEYLNTIDPETGTFFSDDKARQLAADAAASNYRMGWAMLVQDIPQYLALGRVFNPKTMKMEKVFNRAAQKGIKGNFKPWQRTALAYGGTAVSEGLEESYQYFISERGKMLSDLNAGLINEDQYYEGLRDLIGDEEMQTSAFWGAVGGTVFQLAGPVAGRLMESKDTKTARQNFVNNQENFLKNRGAMNAAMQKELARIEQMDDADARKIIIDEMMTDMTVSAIELDSFDTHIQTLQSLANATDEEIAAYSEQAGLDLNKDLFKAYMPEMIQSAKDIRIEYLKSLNSTNNDVKSALAIARNNTNIKKFSKALSEAKSNLKTIQDGVIGTELVSDMMKNGARLKARMKILANINRQLEKRNKKNIPDYQKKINEELISSNLDEMKRVESQYDDLSNIERTSDQIHYDKVYKDGYKGIENDIFQLEKEIAANELGILNTQKQNLYLKSKDYREMRKKKDLEDAMNAIKTSEQAEQAQANLNKSSMDDALKAAHAEALKKKKANLIKKEKLQKTQANKSNHENELSQQAEQANADMTGPMPNTNVSREVDSVEDPFSDEEVDVSNPKQDAQDKIKEDLGNSRNHIKLLDRVGSDAFNEWVLNGRTKTGTPVEFKLGDPVNDDARKAIADFNANKISDHTYNYLPIKVEIDGKPELFTFLPAFSAANEFFPVNELPQRMNIIHAMKDGPVTSEISLTTGGELQLDIDDSGNPVDNKLTDILGITGTSSLDMMVTDQEGSLINMSKDPHPDYLNTSFMVTNVTDNNGKAIPYKGGVFLNVTKADGTKFPLRLNLARIKRAEAELIADLMIEVGVKKSIKFTDKLREIIPELSQRIEEALPQEFGINAYNTTVADFLNLMVYSSEQTKGLASELYMKDDSIKFSGGKIDKENISNKDSREALINFLTNTKRRQFNVSQWQENPKYRDYMVNNKVVSTNAVVGKPLFDSGRDRKVSLYVKRISESSTTQIAENTSDPTFDDRKKRSLASVKFDGFAQKIRGYYHGPNGAKAVPVDGSSKAEISKKIYDLFEAEKVSVKEVSPSLDNNAKNVVPLQSKSSNKKSKKGIKKGLFGPQTDLGEIKKGGLNKDCD